MNDIDYLKAYALGARVDALGRIYSEKSPMNRNQVGEYILGIHHPMTKESSVITERPGEPLPDHPPVPDDAPYIGDVVQGSTSVPQPETFTGDVDPEQLRDLSQIQEKPPFYYYVVLTYHGTMSGGRFLSSKVDIDVTLNRIMHDALVGHALADVQHFMQRLYRSFDITDMANNELRWARVNVIPHIALPYAASFDYP